MTLLYQHELRVRLSERLSRLRRIVGRAFENELALFVQWIESQPYLAALLAELEAAPIDLQEWQSTGGFGRQTLKFPNDDKQRAKLCWQICRAGNPLNFAHNLSAETKFAAMFADYIDVFVDPLVNYLHDQLEDDGSVLGVLERYKRRTEWFHQADLFAKYEAATSQGEAQLDAHLREYLVDQGISYPFSQPASPSGEADVVANLGADHPLALEIKLFLPEAGKSDAYIRQGFAQAVRYAQDYNLPDAYLVVYNLSKEVLIFDGDESQRWPPIARVGDKTVFLIAIQTNPDRPSASRDRKLTRHLIAATGLRGE